MRTFIYWTSSLVVLVILAGCNFLTGPGSNPPPEQKPLFAMTVSKDAVSCVVGDTVSVSAKVSWYVKQPLDSLSQSITFLTKNEAIAMVGGVTVDTAAHAVISCRTQGATNVDLWWTNGDTVLTQSIAVTAAMPANRTFILSVHLAHLGEVPQGMQAKVWWPQLADTLRVPVNANGTVAVAVPRIAARKVSFHLSGDNRYHPAAYVYTYPSDMVDTGRMAVIPLPVRYVVPKGIGAGDTVPVSIEGLYQLSGDGVWNWLEPEEDIKEVLAGKFPRTVCFEPDKSTITVLTAADSAEMKLAFSEMRDSLGQEVYRFGDGTDCQMRLRIDTTKTTSTGSISLVVLRHRPSYLSRSVLVHELGHGLGLGHTCSWKSVMSTECGPALSSPGFSRMDNAMWQLVAETLSLELALGNDAVSLKAAHQALESSAGVLAKASILVETDSAAHACVH